MEELKSNSQSTEEALENMATIQRRLVQETGRRVIQRAKEQRAGSPRTYLARAAAEQVGGDNGAERSS